jgi:hypothetical protein
MLRTWKTATVWVMTLLTAASPASACRGRFRGGSAGCYSGYGGYSSYYNVQCAPVACCGEVYSGSDCGSSSPAVSGTYQPAPTDSYPAPSAPAPAPTPSYRPTPAPVQPIPADELPPVEPPTGRPITPAPVAPPVPDMPEATPSPLEEAPMTEPAAPAAPANDVEDLFKETDADKTPAAEPADAAPAPGGDVEDLFKDTDDKKAASTEAAPAEPMDQAAPSEVEELFSEPTDKAEQSVMTESVPAPAPAVMPEEVAPQPIAPAESPLRLWTDNTGKYQVWGRLVTVTSTHVRLLKETGKYTTVPFDRLSRSDLAFVRTQSPSVLAGKF